MSLRNEAGNFQPIVPYEDSEDEAGLEIVAQGIDIVEEEEEHDLLNDQIEEYFLDFPSRFERWQSISGFDFFDVLCTLQDVLWPNSGWKTVSFIDLYQSPVLVKETFRRAMLLVHPDKVFGRTKCPKFTEIGQQICMVILSKREEYLSRFRRN